MVIQKIGPQVELYLFWELGFPSHLVDYIFSTEGEQRNNLDKLLKNYIKINGKTVASPKFKSCSHKVIRIVQNHWKNNSMTKHFWKEFRITYSFSIFGGFLEHLRILALAYYLQGLTKNFVKVYILWLWITF